MTTSSTGPALVISPPPLTPPPNGLLKAAQVLDQTDDRWINGVQFQPENCDDAVIFDPCSGVNPEITVVFNDGASTAGSTTFTSATAAFNNDDLDKSLSSTSTATATLTDGVTTALDQSLTSATANFNASDIGKVVASTATANFTDTDGVSNFDTSLVSATARFSADDVGKTVTSASTANFSVSDGITATNTSLTSATAKFLTSADAGKTITIQKDQTFTDGVTAANTALVSATAAFVAVDAGSVVTGAGIPVGTTIASVTNGTTVVLSAATTATASSVSFTIVARNLVPAATTISSVTNATTVVLSAATTATTTGATITILARKVISAATTIASVTNATTVVLSVATNAIATGLTFVVVARLVIRTGSTIAAIVSSTQATMSNHARATASAVTFTIAARSLFAAGTVISSVTNATTVVLSAPASITASSANFTVSGREVGTNRNGLKTFHPFVVEAHDTCSTFGYTQSDYRGRALRALTVRESKAVEHEFVTGTLMPDNPHLQDDVNTVKLNGGTAVGLRTAMKLLVNAIGSYNLGQGMIHCRSGMVTDWSALQLVKVDNENGKIYTLTGNRIVPGTGYTGAAPDGTAATLSSEWVYATDVVQVWRSAEADTPGLDDPNFKSNLRRDINTITVRAQKPYVVIGNLCTIVAVHVDPTLTT